MSDNGIDSQIKNELGNKIVRRKLQDCFFEFNLSTAQLVRALEERKKMQDERDRLEKEHEASKKQLERMLEKQKKTQEEIDAKLEQIKNLEQVQKELLIEKKLWAKKKAENPDRDHA